MKWTKVLKVNPGEKFRLSHSDPARTFGIKDKEIARDLLDKNKEKLSQFQNLLYAEGKRAVLVVFQGMDTSGKDSTIRHVFSGINPQGCRVTSFKVPSGEELAHDYLWRIHQAVPPKGQIGIFNRSHYEDVLVVRVHKLVSPKVCSERYDEINAFEKILSENGVMILKFFLHISKSEQARRLREREEDPGKNWKMNPNDYKERKLWKDYLSAYETALDRCSTSWAPWFVIPSNKRWFRHYAVSEVLVEVFEHMALPRPGK